MSVKEEVIKAYGDANKRHSGRNLSWIASKPVSVEYAVELMEKALGSPARYNRFKPELIRKVNLVFKKGAKVYLSREGSVCIYVRGKVKETYSGENELVKSVFKADEFGWSEGYYVHEDSLQEIPPEGTWRIWWD